jgi:hypothetical protein
LLLSPQLLWAGATPKAWLRTKSGIAKMGNPISTMGNEETDCPVESWYAREFLTGAC